MRKIVSIIFTLLTLLPLSLAAQDELIQIRRGDCMPDVTDEAALARGTKPRYLPAIKKDWDPNRTYKQLVILVSFSDTDFLSDNPQERYNSMLNEPGYNERQGAGCMAEYYREQSGGLFNVQFDVYGPYNVDTKAQPYTNPNANTRNYGRNQYITATRMMMEEHPDHDFTQYDWDGNGSIEQVIYVCAGRSGNVGSTSNYGYIWPNTSSFTTITTPDGVKIDNYTSSCELWNSSSSCGIGTICHEYTHSLGLPDIYPTSDSAGFSAVDEWDLMDGGNFTNYGWCPPNFTPLEKMLLGWLQPVELTEAVSIKDLKPVSEGGVVYQIKHTDNEYYLLENRQQKGWDLGVPGKGLVIYHVNYSKASWNANTVNNKRQERGFVLVNADDMDYDAWDQYMIDKKLPTYANKDYLNNRHLSTSPYPWSTDSTSFVNSELTDNSVPSATMINTNSEGETLMSKPITNIQMTADGLISFDFMGGTPEFVLGDVNGDGKVDVSDYIGVANYILNIPQETFNEQAADVDKNGIIDVRDYTGIGNIIHTGSPYGSGENSTEE